MITPPMRDSHSDASYANADSIEFKRTPSIANTMEKPKTKNMLFMKISIRTFLDSFKELPARYARNPGIIGNTHGDRNEIIPAKNATHSVMSPSIN